MRTILLATTAIGLLATGCAPHADLAPTPSIAAVRWDDSDVTWQTAITAAPTTSPDAFWPAFGSTELADLIARARIASPTIEGARARVAEARAQIGVARAALMPTVSATGGLTGTRTSSFNTAQFSNSAASAGLDIAYDLDLFGTARAGKRAAVARYAAAGLDAEAGALVVEAETARAYVQHATAAERIALLDRNLTNARELMRIVGVRRREGVATSLDYGLQAVEVRRLEAQRTTLEQGRRAALTAVAVLVGAEAPGFTLGKPALRDLAIPTLDPGQPGDLLFRRPDVRAAEAGIAAARGDVQQARAAFAPSLQLSSGALTQAAALGGPFGLTLTAASSLLAPIFAGGRLKGGLEAASARQRESVARYRQALLVALKEGSDALAAEALSGERDAILGMAIGDARRTATLARRQYLEGAADLVAVLDAERNAVLLQDDAALARQDRLNAAIDVFRALGGQPRASVQVAGPPRRR